MCSLDEPDRASNRDQTWRPPLANPHITSFIIGLGNGLAPNRRQAITLTNIDILTIWPLGKNRWHRDRLWNIFIQENTFENAVCKMAAILYVLIVT